MKLTKEQSADKLLKAQDLYLNTDMEQKRICEILNISEKTFTKWKVKEGWEEIKKASRTSKSSLVSRLIKKLSDNLDNMSADEIGKLSMSIERLSDNRVLMSQRYQTASEFMRFYKDKYPREVDAIKHTTQRLDEYIKYKANGGE